MSHAELPHVLVLGGTTQGRQLAAALAERTAAGDPIGDPSGDPSGVPVRVTSSLAGRVAAPRLPAGDVRIGGFGGVAGLAAWLVAHDVRAVVDATHPYAATMTAHAHAACARVGVPLLRYERPGWSPGPGDEWRRVRTLADAARLADDLGERVFLTIGRQEVAAFADVAAWCLIRAIERPDPPLPARAQLLLDRGPYELAGERELLARWGIDVLVSKDSGGEATAAKLVAAAERGVPVVLVDRPAPPAGLRVVREQPDVLAWLAQTLVG